MRRQDRVRLVKMQAVKEVPEVAETDKAAAEATGVAAPVPSGSGTKS